MKFPALFAQGEISAGKIEREQSRNILGAAAAAAAAARRDFGTVSRRPTLQRRPDYRFSRIATLSFWHILFLSLSLSVVFSISQIGIARECYRMPDSLAFFYLVLFIQLHGGVEG